MTSTEEATMVVVDERQLENPPPKEDEVLPVTRTLSTSGAMPLQPPDNFAQVFPGVYRSSFPKKRS